MFPSNKKRYAGVVLIIYDGKILSVSRKTNHNVFGLPGGKFDPSAGDKSVKDAAIRETKEECNIQINSCIEVYRRTGESNCFCYYADDKECEPKALENAVVELLTVKELTETRAAFPDYNKKAIAAFKKLYPNIKLL